jgi:hypothetical protein
LADSTADCAPTIYVIDTSALVDLRLEYPFRTFGRFLWSRFADLAACGRLVAPEEVRKEIERKDDALKAWASNVDGLFRPADDEFMRCLERVVPACPGLVDLGRQYDADAWVVALALQMQEAEQTKLFASPILIVTHENRQTNTAKLPHIPNAADLFGLRCIRLRHIFNTEPWEDGIDGQPTA